MYVTPNNNMVIISRCEGGFTARPVMYIIPERHHKFYTTDLKGEMINEEPSEIETIAFLKDLNYCWKCFEKLEEILCK